MESNIDFRLAHLNLILAQSKGQLGRWNGVTQNMLAFLSLLLVAELIVSIWRLFDDKENLK